MTKFKAGHLILRTSPFNVNVRIIKKLGGAGYWIAANSGFPGEVINVDSRIVDKMNNLYTDIFSI